MMCLTCVTAPRVAADGRRAIATEFTDAVIWLFTPPRRPDADEVRQRTTVHFVDYGENEIFIGGRTPAQRGAPTSPLR
jgi:hypothetical protein